MAVVCGTDFSGLSRVALSTAASLARRRQEPLLLVHVLDPSLQELAPAARAQLEAAAQGRLQAEAQALPDHTALPVQTAVLIGRPDEALRAFAQEHHASVLVVAAPSQHGSGSSGSIGAVVERLAHSPSVPLLVIRDPHPFEQWATGRPLRLVVGVDDTATSESAVRFAESLRRLGPVDVLLCRVYYAEEGHRRYGLNWSFSRTEVDPQLESFIERDLKRRFPHLEGEGEVFYRGRLGVGNPGDHLIEVAEADRADLVVIGTHGHKGFGRTRSTSSHVLNLSHLSVALVPRDAEAERAARATPQFRRILVATDFSPLGDAAVPYGYALAEADGGEVTLAHVAATAGLARELLEFYFPSPTPPSASPGDLERQIAQKLRSLTPPAADSKGIVTRTAVLRGSDPAKALVECAARVGADVLVLASHGRGGVSRAVTGSVADEVIRHAPCAVFVVRPPTR